MKNLIPRITGILYIIYGLLVFSFQFSGTGFPLLPFPAFVAVILLGIGTLSRRKSVILFSAWLFVPIWIWHAIGIFWGQGFDAALTGRVIDPSIWHMHLVAFPVFFVLTIISYVIIKKVSAAKSKILSTSN